MYPESNNPIIDIEKNETDKWLEIITMCLVLICIALTAYYYSQLPDTIPTHINGRGEVDGYGPKYFTWFIPGFAVLMAGGLHVVLKVPPHKYNYIYKVTPENAQWQYSNAMTMMRLLNMLIASMSLCMVFMFLAEPLGHNSTFYSYILYIPLAAVVIVPIWMGMRKPPISKNINPPMLKTRWTLF